MIKLFSYVVDHDTGYAPNPFGDYCTLAKCMYGFKRRNIVEMAEEGHWVAGTGGTELSRSAGHGKLIYAMRVKKKISLQEYCRTNRGSRIDAEHEIDEDGRFALLATHFFYFGRNAVDVYEIPTKYLHHDFEKRGRRYRCDFSGAFIEDFASWLDATFEVGVHGPPCKPHSELRLPRLPMQIRRKGK